MPHLIYGEKHILYTLTKSDEYLFKAFYIPYSCTCRINPPPIYLICQLMTHINIIEVDFFLQHLSVGSRPFASTLHTQFGIISCVFNKLKIMISKKGTEFILLHTEVQNIFQPCGKFKLVRNFSMRKFHVENKDVMWTECKNFVLISLNLKEFSYPLPSLKLNQDNNICQNLLYQTVYWQEA